MRWRLDRELRSQGIDFCHDLPESNIVIGLLKPHRASRFDSCEFVLEDRKFLLGRLAIEWRLRRRLMDRHPILWRQGRLSRSLRAGLGRRP